MLSGLVIYLLVVFLISKSNCAFVNYKTETSCAAAMSRFHDSRFQGVRLVCRLRRGSASAASATQPAQATASPPTAAVVATLEPGAEVLSADESAIVDDAPTAEREPLGKLKEKFFIVKSLTIQEAL
jgi:hypothetical protein